MTRTASEKTLAAEVRWVEAGHLIRFDRGRGVALAKSDTREGVTYEVSAGGVSIGGVLLASFACTCPAGRRHAPAGSTGCRHAAGLARRLEREGLVSWVDGVWHVTARAAELAPAPVRDFEEQWAARAMAVALTTALNGDDSMGYLSVLRDVEARDLSREVILSLSGILSALANAVAKQAVEDGATGQTILAGIALAVANREE